MLGEVNPRGPHHCASSLGSVSARKTTGRGGKHTSHLELKRRRQAAHQATAYAAARQAAWAMAVTAPSASPVTPPSQRR